MSEAAQSLNAPSGAGCFLTFPDFSTQVVTEESLNAPSGAGCFLTRSHAQAVVSLQES